MRKIEREMLSALHEGRAWQSGNTTVTAPDNTGRAAVYLHGNHVADWRNGELEVDRSTLARWPTTTMISRLSALGADVYRRDFTPYLDGKPIY